MSQVRGCQYISLWRKSLSAALGHAGYHLVLIFRLISRFYHKFSVASVVFQYDLQCYSQISYCSQKGTRFRLGYCSCLVREERFFLFLKGHIAGSKSIKSDITFAFFIYKINFACYRNTCKWREINMYILHTHSFTVHLALTRRI